MGDRPFNCPKCCKPTNMPDVWCDDCGGALAQLNIQMVLDGMRCAEFYEQQITDQMVDREDDTIGPGRIMALVRLKMAAHEIARMFHDEVVRRAER